MVNRNRNQDRERRPLRRSARERNDRIRRSSRREERMEKAEVMLKAEVLDAIDDVAQQEGVSTGQVFEAAINDWLDSYYDESQDSHYYEDDER